jgi:hypothetical protein
MSVRVSAGMRDALQVQSVELSRLVLRHGLQAFEETFHASACWLTV